ATTLQPAAESPPPALPALPVADEALQPAATISIPKPGRPSAPAAVTPTADVVPPAQAASAAPDEAELFRCFLEGAGLAEFPKLTAEEQKRAMKNLGLVFRDMVSSMIDALRARAEAKREVRVDMTLIGKANNNPLKFSVTVEDAMKIMIADKYPGFMSPVEAVREGFGDIMNHQLAMTAGIQASLGDLLKRFDPKIFEQPYAEGFVLRKESKCWNAYSKAYPNLVRESMDDLFGDQFVDVYEEQMRILRGSRGKS
ncbi:MAG: type VI secretion system-associated FHA domain protein TagH, partial [Methylococcaceae bacterium]|nr:type VI secretion system-associated FHA domain protein TagH [Methylococcaceae bacterium]